MQHRDFAPHTGITLNMFTAIRSTFKEAVTDATGPTAAAQIQWTKSAVPTISNIETVVDAMPRPRPDAWRTRLKAWRNWKTVGAITNNALDNILPYLPFKHSCGNSQPLAQHTPLSKELLTPDDTVRQGCPLRAT